MDPISYGVAAKQKQRIEKVIAEPDSTSGVITVPQVIAAGETITVPAGRTAVLPNTTVNGTLVVDGEVFIPSGTGLSTVVQKSGDTMSGNLNFASGTRITGDFSNATVSNRVAFQTSTSNNTTTLSVFPKGTGTGSKIEFYSAEDYVNNSVGRIALTTNEFAIAAIVKGSGAYLPITFYSGGSERMRIDTSGNVGIGGTPATKLDTYGNGRFLQVSQDTTGAVIIREDAASTNGGVLQWVDNTNVHQRGYIKIKPNGSWNFANNYGSILTIDTSFNVLVTLPSGFGYGTGSGGTVTQLTSKSTAVTLNKPTGQITMNNAALAAGASVMFQVNCSVCSHYDVPIAAGAWTTVLPENYRIEATKISYPSGVFFIKVTNVSGVSLSEDLTINFAILKGANA